MRNLSFLCATATYVGPAEQQEIIFNMHTLPVTISSRTTSISFLCTSSTFPCKLPTLAVVRGSRPLKRHLPILPQRQAFFKHGYQLHLNLSCSWPILWVDLHAPAANVQAGECDLSGLQPCNDRNGIGGQCPARVDGRLAVCK